MAYVTGKKMPSEQRAEILAQAESYLARLDEL